MMWIMWITRVRSPGPKRLYRLLSIALWFTIARHSPAAELAPKIIFGLYAPPGKAPTDSIRITPKHNGKVGVSLKLYYANGHTCELDKEGDWQAGRLLVMAEGLQENQPCRLEVSFQKNRILLKDPGQRCAQVYCGARGKLDSVSLPKRSSVPN